jgi:uncharacterized membrane protein YeaQ/YmgE (transglycosylase-associated protein family)
MRTDFPDPYGFGRRSTGVREDDIPEDTSMIVNILLWCLFGLFAGLVAKFIGKAPERSDPMGLVLTVGLGIAGALVGGFLSSQLFGWDINTFSIQGFAVAVGGALLLLLLYQLMISARKAT